MNPKEVKLQKQTENNTPFMVQNTFFTIKKLRNNILNF